MWLFPIFIFDIFFITINHKVFLDKDDIWNKFFEESSDILSCNIANAAI